MVVVVVEVLVVDVALGVVVVVGVLVVDVALGVVVVEIVVGVVVVDVVVNFEAVVTIAVVKVEVSAELDELSKLLVVVRLSDVSKICTVDVSDVCTTSEVASSDEVEMSVLAVWGSSTVFVSVTVSEDVVNVSVAPNVVACTFMLTYSVMVCAFEDSFKADYNTHYVRSRFNFNWF